MINKVKQKELLEFFRTFSLLQRSKISVNNSLELILKQTKNENFKKIIKEINTSVKGGNPVSKSFAKYPNLFSNVFVANLKVAEETGQIAEVLYEYTGYIEKMQNLKRKIIQAVRYPLVVIIVAVGVVFFMLFFIIPTFEGLFQSAHADLPFLTQMLLEISKFLTANVEIVILTFLIFSFLIHLVIKTKASFVNELIWKTPVISRIYRNNILARFTLSMSILLKSKVSLLESLKISREITGDSFFKTQIEIIIKKITRGESLTSNIAASKFFDITFSKLLAAGEESAELDKVFFLMSNYYNSEFDYYLDNITALLEPFLIIGVGGIVALILVSLYLPMFEIIKYFGV